MLNRRFPESNIVETYRLSEWLSEWAESHWPTTKFVLRRENDRIEFDLRDIYMCLHVPGCVEKCQMPVALCIP